MRKLLSIIMAIVTGSISIVAIDFLVLQTAEATRIAN